MQGYRKLTTICCAAVLALGLAACGGGGSDSPTTGNGGQMQGPTPVEQIAELQTQINALRAELGLDPIDIDDLTGSVSDLQGQVTALEREIANRDQTIADAAAKAMTAQGKLLFKVLDSFGGAFTANTTRPTAEVAPVATPPAVSAKHGAATTLTPENLETFVEGLSAIDTDTAYTAAQAGDPAMLAMNNGFSGTMLTWSNSGKADTMAAYTDIGAPVGRPFSEVYGGGTQELDPADTAHKGVMGAAFDGRTGGQVVHAPNAKVNATDATNTMVRLPGSYQGAAGQWTCTPGDAGTCATRVSADGITFVDNGAATQWMFTANNGAMVSVADSTYMTFGWWMRDNKSTADALDHIAVFYSAPHPDALAITALTGKANYEGGAAGKYAWRDRVADTAHGGHFTAEASLTADFGDAAGIGTVSGSISDFYVGDDGTHMDWTVTLGSAALNDGGAVARVGAGVDPNVTWAVGSVKANAAGSWEAQLSNSGARRNDDLPTGIAGAFNTTFNEQGRMIGAFGANITNPNPPKN